MYVTLEKFLKQIIKDANTQINYNELMFKLNSSEDDEYIATLNEDVEQLSIIRNQAKSLLKNIN